MNHELLTAIANLMENKWNPEMQHTMRDIVSSELKPELMDSVRDMVNNELKPDLMDNMRDMVNNELEPKLMNSVRDMVNNELKPNFMLSMSQMMDNKLKPVNERLKKIELTQENDILPRLRNIEECYTSTYKRYQKEVERLDAQQDDIDILKKVVSNHSEKLQRLA